MLPAPARAMNHAHFRHRLNNALFRVVGLTLFLVAFCQAGWGTDPVNGAAPQPQAAEVTTATIYKQGSSRQTVLFNFRRQTTRSGTNLNVLREYTYPDGKVAFREHVVYASEAPVSLAIEELQIDSRGSASFRTEAGPGGKRVAALEYVSGVSSGAKAKTGEETLQNNTVIDDTFAVFITSYWDALAQGKAVSFRYLSVPRRETVGFSIARDSETVWEGKPAIVLKMEPSSFFIRQLVDPVFFTVEKTGQHRILRYMGRTAPKIRTGSKWGDLDAEIVYHWS
jgi:hypothetical protein